MSEISTLYLKTHNKTGLQYLGVTHKDPYTYLGSGKDWEKHIKTYGRHDVITEILFQDKMIGKYTSDKFQEMSKKYSYVYNVVEDKGFANLKHEDGAIGAMGNIWHGFDDVYDKWDNKLAKEFVKTDKDDVINHYDQVDVELKEMGHQEKGIMTEDLQKTVANALLSLTPKEEVLIRHYFGIGLDENYAYEEIVNKYGGSITRVRMAICRALRKLKHPSKGLSQLVMG